MSEEDIETTFSCLKDKFPILRKREGFGSKVWYNAFEKIIGFGSKNCSSFDSEFRIKGSGFSDIMLFKILWNFRISPNCEKKSVGFLINLINKSSNFSTLALVCFENQRK
jgi:hypothetical protein